MRIPEAYRHITYFGRVGSAESNSGQSVVRAMKSVPTVEGLPDEYVALDTETTGLRAGRDRIIEIGAVKVRDRRVVDSFSSLVNPGMVLSSTIVELTGIDDEMLAGEDHISQILPSFFQWLGGMAIVGHNLNFDLRFLQAEAELLGQKVPRVSTYDTMYMSRRLFPQHRHHRLADLIQRFDIDDIEEHRALSDAEQTHQCFEWMRSYMMQV
ncbi:PolC-type DNA polymerase III [Bombiscardovia coagulans]|uniref:Exonuclease n=1 Tax=Bombiscardovia coagulans TaxID=686666 RepID=A0A261ETK3_9BIFI|nr:3'-5' exonuclease [Bombiscardovia coagulans]OZG50194.1 exonuclease [Bombiscardovia coagulans]